MKSKVKELFIILVAVLLTACGKKAVSPDTPYVIEGEVTEILAGHEVVLVEYDGFVGNRIASDTIRNGKFRFEGVMKEPELNWLSLIVMSNEIPPIPCVVYVAPGAHIKVTGHDDHVYTWDVESKVPEQRANQELIEPVKAEWEEYQTLAVASHKAINEYYAINRDKEPERKKEAYDRYKRINSQMDSVYDEISAKTIEQMKKMKPSQPWMRELENMSQSALADKSYKYTDELKALFESLPQEIRQSEKGHEIYSNLFPPTKVKEGDDCPDADFYDLQGNLHHISDFKGKYILLDFWSSGCGPCIASFPELKEVYERYADRLSIISISTDTDRRWRKASEQHKITWNNWNEGKGTGGLYSYFPIVGIPHYVLVNPQGIIEKQIEGYREGMFQTLFTELFGGK